MLSTLLNALETPEGDDTQETDDTTDVSCDALSFDSIFFTLSNSRRRSVIYCLKREDGPLDVSRLTTLITAMENDTPPENVTYRQRKRVYTSLHQSHLPKMDDLGIIEFDQRAGTVEPDNGLDEIDVYLEIVPGSEISWSEFYLGLGVLSIAVCLLALVNVYPFGVVPDLAYGIGVAVALVIVSATHWRHMRTRSIDDDVATDVLQDNL